MSSGPPSKRLRKTVGSFNVGKQMSVIKAFYSPSLNKYSRRR